MSERKNYEAAVPFFRSAFKLARKLGDDIYELSSLNNFISSLRMLGAAGCPEAMHYKDLALFLAAKLDLKNVNSRVGAYVNVGFIHILEHDWLSAILMLNSAENLIDNARETEFIVTPKMVGQVAQCAAQARIGLLTSSGAELERYCRHRDFMIFEIYQRLQHVLDLELPEEVPNVFHT